MLLLLKMWASFLEEIPSFALKFMFFLTKLWREQRLFSSWSYPMMMESWPSQAEPDSALSTKMVSVKKVTWECAVFIFGTNFHSRLSRFVLGHFPGLLQLAGDLCWRICNHWVWTRNHNPILFQYRRMGETSDRRLLCQHKWAFQICGEGKWGIHFTPFHYNSLLKKLGVCSITCKTQR